MKPAAIGIRAHSGWAALVVVSAEMAVLDRQRLALTEPKTAGANQPYHFVREQDLRQAEEYLAHCFVISEKLAFDGLEAVVSRLRDQGYVAVGCAILLSSGRPLPPLANILASHSLVHTAEGEFFRQALWKASERLKIEVTGIRERELDEHAETVFGSRLKAQRRDIATAGASIGPPWTSDQKIASLAGLLVLAGSRQ